MAFSGAGKSKGSKPAAIERKDSVLSESSEHSSAASTSPNAAAVENALKRPNTMELLAASRASKIMRKVGSGKGYGKEYAAAPAPDFDSRPLASPQQQPPPTMQPLSLKQTREEAMERAKAGCCAELAAKMLKEVVDGYVETIAHVAEHWIGKKVIRDIDEEDWQQVQMQFRPQSQCRQVLEAMSQVRKQFRPHCRHVLEASKQQFRAQCSEQQLRPHCRHRQTCSHPFRPRHRQPQKPSSSGPDADSSRQPAGNKRRRSGPNTEA